MVVAFEGVAEEDETGEEEGEGEVDDEETSFGLEAVGGVVVDGEAGEEVVEVVPDCFSQDSSNDWREEEEAYCLVQYLLRGGIVPSEATLRMSYEWHLPVCFGPKP